MNRRTLLKSGIAGIGLVTAGCLGDDDSDGIGGSIGGAEEGKRVVWDGDVLEIDSVTCNDPMDDYEFIAVSEVMDVDDGVNFRIRKHTEEGFYIIQLTFSHEEGNERYRTQIDVNGDVEFDWADSTAGEVTLEPVTDIAEATAPDGGVVEWDVSC